MEALQNEPAIWSVIVLVLGTPVSVSEKETVLKGDIVHGIVSGSYTYEVSVTIKFIDPVNVGVREVLYHVPLYTNPTKEPIVIVPDDDVYVYGIPLIPVN